MNIHEPNWFLDFDFMRTHLYPLIKREYLVVKFENQFETSITINYRGQNEI